MVKREWPKLSQIGGCLTSILENLESNEPGKEGFFEFLPQLSNQKKRGGIAPLQPPTLASVKTWGIQQELVVPPEGKGKSKYIHSKCLNKNQSG
jgi:hypothetical protein